MELYPPTYGPHAELPADPPRLGRRTLEHLRRHRGYDHLPRAADGALRRLWQSMLDPLVRHNVGILLIPSYVAGGRLLDVGCGDGAMLRLLRELGWQDLHGIEPGPEAARVARSTGASVLSAGIEDAIDGFPDAHFDAIVASMVMEHLEQPYAVVAQLARKLRPGGELLLSTVDRGSVDARFYGAYWAGFDFPRHMTYFRRRDIEALVAPYFSDVEWFHQVAPIDWVRSASWRASPVDRLLLRARLLLLPLSTICALAGRATRVSLRGRRIAPRST